MVPITFAFKEAVERIEKYTVQGRDRFNGIDVATVRSVVENDLPELQSQVETILQDEELH